MSATLLSLPRELRQDILFYAIKLTCDDITTDLIQDKDKHCAFPCACEATCVVNRPFCKWTQERLSLRCDTLRYGRVQQMIIFLEGLERINGVIKEDLEGALAMWVMRLWPEKNRGDLCASAKTKHRALLDAVREFRI
jgi:hypothetical protein